MDWVEAKSDQVAADINAAGGRAISVSGNVMDPAFPERLVEETVKAFGKLNHIVNNAGYTHDGMIHKMSDKQWDAMLLVHQTAPFKIIRAASKYLVSWFTANKINYATLMFFDICIAQKGR